ncbi:hypothetical protein EG68_05930 [Paragonimus skrjabini miyazakii]|uniref:DNA polymerase n=1 Tax=Paragonimus skrjabini miyazakii TaxID=59628 RepID=A0A8S9YDZ0_9TREM|nr:hypothetical protein EG68_05930 [Paragonimus skrjabini miyazakii]
MRYIIAWWYYRTRHQVVISGTGLEDSLCTDYAGLFFSICSTLYGVPTTTDDFVSEWLRQSQEDDLSNLDMDVQPEPTVDTFSMLVDDQIVSPRSERESVASGEAGSLTSTQVLLNAASQYELQRIASATEEVDALVPTGDSREGLPWGFLKSTSEWRSVENQKSLINGLHGQDVLHSTAVGPELLGFSDANQGTGLMGLSPSRLSSASTLLVNPRSCSSFGDIHPVDDEATLLSQATRSAIQYVYSGGRDVHGSLDDFEHVVEAFDDASMLDLVDTGIEDWEDVEDQEWFTQIDVTGDSRHALNHDLVADRVSHSNHDPPIGELERIEELDERSMSPVSLTEEDVSELLPLSPWSLRSDISASSPLPCAKNTETCQSQSLFDSLHSGDCTNISLLNNKDDEPIPQVDGTGDTEPSDSDNTVYRAPEPQPRSRRRRLGLRLTSHRMAKFQRVNATLGDERQSVHLAMEDTGHVSSLPIRHHASVSCQAVTQATQNVPLPEQNLEGSCVITPVSPTTTNDDTFSAFQFDKKLLNRPVVLIEPIGESLRPQAMTESMFMDFGHAAATSHRLSPKDEFEDISTDNHTQPGVTDPVREAGSDESPSMMPSQPNLFDVTLGNLTLFSQTQCSSSSSVSELSSPELLPIEIPIQERMLTCWVPKSSAPSLDVVARWLDQTAVNQLSSGNQTTTNDGVAICDSSLSDANTPVKSDSSSEEQSIQAAQCTSVGFTTCPTRSTVEHPADASAADNSLLSTNSFSVLYQTASKRCFLPVQADHTTVFSLELHCHIRMMSAFSRRKRIALGPPPINKPPSSTPTPRAGAVRGLLPDPALDSVLLACLTVRQPSLKQAAQTVNLQPFVFVNMCIFPNDFSNTGHPSGLPSRLGLTNYLSNFQRLLKACQPRFIWCTDEWNLLSWLVYFIQCFDPEILIGYDVERFSWGYLVERANRLGRNSYVRELSRLAPDIYNCPSCHVRITQCKQFVDQQDSVHLDVSSLINTDLGECVCPCRPFDPESAPSNPISPVRFSYGWPAGPGAGQTGGPFPCPGRVVLCLWRVVMPDLNLFEYSLETVVLNLLKETVPKFPLAQLHQWLIEVPGVNRWRTVDYWCFRSVANLRIIDALDIIGRTSEFARVFGIEFFHVLSRGSQYRVESLLGRVAKRGNYLLASPTVAQRARQRAPEVIPLNLEPDSRLYIDGPVAVLDFQSLYPSIMIAYNYCYSTVLGRLTCLQKGEENLFDLGCLSHYLPVGLIQRLRSNVNISPNGVVFVDSTVREGVLPRILRQLLTTRLMIKDSMKLYKCDKSLTRLLDARQLGIKLMANVIYGYTSASFSGRMPCVELGDSIVHKARETLERAIHWVDSGDITLPACVTGRTKPRVVYGDTDSLFIHLPGCGQSEAFIVAQTIADTISARNPAPIKLKLEKVYYPCLLEAKKRYVGYAYESPTQTVPTFDAKGIETVRRDGCPFVGKVLEETLRMMFDQFPLPPATFTARQNASELVADGSYKPSDFSNVGYQLKLAQTRVQEIVHRFGHRLMHGQIRFADCLLSRPYWGQTAYRPGAFAPALQVTRRLLSLDPRAEPAVGERVVYFVAPGRTDQTLISCVRAVAELCPLIMSATTDLAVGRRVLAPRLNLSYYLDKQLIPPLERFAQLLGWNVQRWLSDLPRHPTIPGHRHRLAPWPRSDIFVDSPSSPSCSLNRLGSFGSPSSSFSQSPGPSTRGRRPVIRRRQSALMRAFVGRPVRVCPSCAVHVPLTARTDPFGHCMSCVEHHAGLTAVGAVRFGAEFMRASGELARAERICTGCMRHRGAQCDAIWLCISVHCPAHSDRLLASAGLACLWTKYTNQLTTLDSTASWT